MKKLKLSTKLMIAFSAMAIINILGGGIGFFGVGKLETHLQEIGTKRLPGIANLYRISDAQVHIRSAENALLCKEISEAGREARYKNIATAWNEADQGWKAYEPLPKTGEEDKLWKQFVPVWDAWKKDHEKYIQMTKDQVQMIKDGVSASKIETLYAQMVEQALTTNEETFSTANNLLNQLTGLNLKLAEKQQEKASADAAFGQTLNILGMIVGTILAIGYGAFWGTTLSRPIQNIARKLGMGAQQSAAAAGQVSSASQSLADGANQQAASLQQTSSSLEEMASMTKQNAENAQSAKDLAAETRHAADIGAADMKKMNVAMTEIKKSSDDVSKIIKTIDEIAFQTNILALNAAVEAARAGEAGMGFAVVADEVRALAQRSAQAAKETAEKIQDAVAKSEQGVQISTKVGDSLQEIVEKARKMDELVAEIAGASKEQNQGISQVNHAVSQMDKVTQSNAAHAEETASAAEELDAQAEELRLAVQELLAIVNGASIETKRFLNEIPAPVPQKPPVAAPKKEEPLPFVRQTQPPPTPAPKPSLPVGEPPRKIVLDKKAKEIIPMDDDFKDF